jgi:hypothetical protein
MPSKKARLAPREEEVGPMCGSAAVSPMEYKKRHANLGAALKQLLNYVGALANLPLLLTCDTPPGPNCLLAGLHQALCQARQERRGRRRCLLRSDVTPRNALRSGQERGAESDADAAQDARLLVKQRTMSVKRAPRPSFGVRHYCRQGKLSSAMCGRFTHSYTWLELIELYRLTQPPGVRAAVFGANPQATGAAVKMATPSANARRRPKRSPAEPPARISAPCISM